MPKTRRGIYHNLMESEYTVSENEIVFFFSSAFYQKKFLESYKDHREAIHAKMEKLLDGIPFTVSTLADLNLYETIETRGFYATLQGREVTCQELYRYALQRLTDPSSPN